MFGNRTVPNASRSAIVVPLYSVNYNKCILNQNAITTPANLLTWIARWNIQRCSIDGCVVQLESEKFSWFAGGLGSRVQLESKKFSWFVDGSDSMGQLESEKFSWFVGGSGSGILSCYLLPCKTGKLLVIFEWWLKTSNSWRAMTFTGNASIFIIYERYSIK